ncbi:LLM class F420-dependent oxidoreductase [Gryllotalpicola ginsengisoli]|uniref:LLM class F420-dependent oxidoreductase n=1 Tax=Gryllotalpicola ginsengisoli TaxID=444608 RepID=UPI0003B5CF98|nr:LLM class F420-dependent oxidoreductase [Gryllotalpicola ginsengisoli]
MDFRIFIEPQQGASYEDQLQVAQAAERLGFSAFFRSDHFLSMGGDGLPGPTDSWVTLGAIARETSTIRLGTLVTSATFRHPGLLAIQVAQVDAMSAGRVELGLGAGWFEQEHTAYGFPFPTQRFGILEEQLAVITGLWSTPVGERFSFAGTHYVLADSPALPKPVQNPLPVILGGAGKPRSAALAVKYAGEYNSPFLPDDQHAEVFGRVRRAVEEAGRDADSLVYSVAKTTAVGTTDAEAKARAERIGRDPQQLREEGLGGTVAEVVDHLGRLSELGVTRVYLQLLDLHDLDHLELIAREVVPAFAG